MATWFQAITPTRAAGSTAGSSSSGRSAGAWKSETRIRACADAASPSISTATANSFATSTPSNKTAATKRQTVPQIQAIFPPHCKTSLDRNLDDVLVPGEEELERCQQACLSGCVSQSVSTQASHTPFGGVGDLGGLRKKARFLFFGSTTTLLLICLSVSWLCRHAIQHSL